ncbi:uncharacterized protein [Ovis canadensis]|uniref:uncharacterized protein isoform X3 n=1 Tax=Ovis canadensis TaxID=37174 RepID=UPI0038B4AE3C
MCEVVGGMSLCMTETSVQSAAMVHKRGQLWWHTSVAERSYPTSEVRGRSREDSMPEGKWQVELPHIRYQGQRPKVPGCDGTGTGLTDLISWQSKRLSKVFSSTTIQRESENV